jgi:hypothetical protein
MWVRQNFEFENDLVAICEGLADKAFLQSLATARRLANFDCPWPADPEIDVEAPPEAQRLAGKSRFGDILRALDGQLIYRPDVKKRIKGIVFLADAGDNPNESFRSVTDQIIQVQGWGIPAEPYSIAQSSTGIPPVGILLVPPNNHAGSLETLCVDFFRESRPDEYKCMEEYFRCGPINVTSWNAEKQAKAKLQCLVAATNKSDPTRTLRRLFASHSGGLIDLQSTCFDAIAQKLREIADAFSAK